MNSRWNNDEMQLVVQGVKKFGKDFQAIADTIGTKTQSQVRFFCSNHRRRYDLEAAMKEFQKTQQLENSNSININNHGMNGSNAKNNVGEIMEVIWMRILLIKKIFYNVFGFLVDRPGR